MTPNYNYIKDNEFAPKVLKVGGRQIINPSEEDYLRAGYTRVPAYEPTEAEQAAQQRQARIAELHTLLEQSDYKAIKYAEGWITEADYAAVKAERQAWRDEINALEAFGD